MADGITLLIMAAGMGSRYGGMKQIDHVDEEGDKIIDFSIYDAVQAGFDRVIFVIKRENLEIFRKEIGDRLDGHIKTEYAFQALEDIPAPHACKCAVPDRIPYVPFDLRKCHLVCPRRRKIDCLHVYGDF